MIRDMFCDAGSTSDLTLTLTSAVASVSFGAAASASRSARAAIRSCTGARGTSRRCLAAAERARARVEDDAARPPRVPEDPVHVPRGRLAVPRVRGGRRLRLAASPARRGEPLPMRTPRARAAALRRMPVTFGDLRLEPNNKDRHRIACRISPSGTWEGAGNAVLKRGHQSSKKRGRRTAHCACDAARNLPQR